MWFAFGFISLIGFVIFSIYKRVIYSWKGKYKKIDGVDYKYNFVINKNKLKRIYIGMDVKNKFDLMVKRENSFDCFFKKIKISREYQTGNVDFDKKIYIASDNKNLNQELFTSKILQNIITKIFSLDGSYNAKIKEVRNTHSMLWIELTTNVAYSEELINNIASTYILLLKSLCDELDKITNKNVAFNLSDPFIFKASIILAISSGLALNGLYSSYILIYINLPFLVEPKELFVNSVLVGILIIFILIIISIIILKRSSRTHLVLIELSVVGLFGAITTSFIELRNINIYLDDSKVQKIVTKVVNKDISRNRRGPDSYYLYLEDWKNKNKIRKIEVSSDNYYIYSKNQNIELFQKSGFIGYKWIEKINKPSLQTNMLKSNKNL